MTRYGIRLAKQKELLKQELPIPTNRDPTSTAFN